MVAFLRQIRQAANELVRERTFSAVVVLTLALVIGANTAIFSVLNAVLFRPLPYPEPERLVALYNSYPKVGVEIGGNGVTDYFDRRALTDVFSAVALFDYGSANLGLETSPERLVSMRTTPELFPALGVQPLLGRLLGPDDTVLGKQQVTVLSESLWRRQFAAAPDIVGREVRLNGLAHTIVGVVPDRFDPSGDSLRAELILPFAFTDEERSDDNRHSNFATMLARLAPGVTLAQAQARIEALNREILEKAPQFKEVIQSAGFHTPVVGWHALQTRDIESKLYLLQAGVALVLLIGAFNVANLMLVRSGRQLRPLSVRLALGASRASLARQVLTEAALLTGAGALLGVALASLSLGAFTQLGLAELPRGGEIALDRATLLFAAGISALCGLLLSLIPLVRALGSNLADVFRGSSRAASAGRGATWLRSSLVVTQICGALILVVVAGLLASSFRRVLAVEPGFDATGVLTAQVALPESRYTDEQRGELAQRALARLAALPGVAHAAVASDMPFLGGQSASVVSIEGKALAAGEQPPVPRFFRVTPDFHEVLSIPLREGRRLEATDMAADAPTAVLIDEVLARRHWPGESPLGKRLRQGLGDNTNAPWMTIVGVVGEVRSDQLTESDGVGALYLPLRRSPDTALALALRTERDPRALVPMVRQAVLELDRELPIFDVLTMEERLGRSIIDQKAPMTLLAVFAGLALLLAAIGIYGLLAYSVEQRKKELGVRAALGAEPRGLLGMVLSQGSKLIGLGLALGLVGSLAVGRLVAAQLFETRATDPLTLTLAGLVLALVGLLAAVGPSLRAARVDPISVLQED